MAASGISESIERFVRAHIGSIAQLEVLVFLHATADREWRAPEVSRELRSSVPYIQGRLEDLAAKGFLHARTSDAGPSYRYAPRTEETREVIDALIDLYTERRVTVINLIYRDPDGDAVSFSEAFRIAKKTGDR